MFDPLYLLNCTVQRQFLYPTPGLSASEQIATLRQQDGQYELFTYVEKTLRQGLQQMVLQDVEKIKGGSVSLSGDTLLAGAIAMALCYIHRYSRKFLMYLLVIHIPQETHKPN